ncbi:hypothetical protein A3C23_01810 [Candidatus Roizmanbacteria bacterium RIFCSPHIGHO2_02_FULL_37_13b]|uniref:Nucleotidyl transferase AbiEii/AbiGii toxin family protein n=1 Tax=Candidatus Roizmanbacteria bacterium RIFCSPLOWO2_02_FULL_36_11 TaxID=1802071 RepID=A0A1F7JCY4_9BACT|nr:MAG: hypothetical protein A3C23_01810 [Candidatus Roizmanbacteria bacterium RIFCSPHIGHO2_02_FULL_37_13b]OGK53471.1 MAG: hypothetical protein A3H78_02970 [Candidatus Roizmanbacteria bacterium RIFCSPLOWO2_02_FULL_36_11]
MILPRSEDALHKAQLYRLLIEIIDDHDIASQVFFKGGSCAAMLGFLDRFSIDLDFDVKKNTDKKTIDFKLNKIFHKLGLEVKQKSRRTLFYLLKYHSSGQFRNTIKLSLIDQALKSNIYQHQYLFEIDRYAVCQTKETMFANKLVAVTDRYQKYKTIAGRDIYDIHHFFIQGYPYHASIIEERTAMTSHAYLIKLVKFIEKKVTDKIITQDLNFLLPQDQFHIMRKVLVQEVLMFLKRDIEL